EIADEPFAVEDGYVDLPGGPGLGIDLDEDALAEYPYRQEPPRNVRRYHEEGP
ncbi:MAG: mandelate racemase/muconate lactonizing enzyme family protein, partial [Actinobacteria bacterium QS_8_72_14]